MTSPSATSHRRTVERHYSVRSAAKIFDRSPDWVLDRIKAGDFSKILDLGGSRAAYRIPESEIQAFIEKKTIELEKPGAGTPGRNTNL